MNKSKPFLITLGAAISSAIFFAIGIVFEPFIESQIVSRLVFFTGTTLAVVALACYLVRQERQNQRVNRKALNHQHTLTRIQTALSHQDSSAKLLNQTLQSTIKDGFNQLESSLQEKLNSSLLHTPKEINDPQETIIELDDSKHKTLHQLQMMTSVLKSLAQDRRGVIERQAIQIEDLKDEQLDLQHLALKLENSTREIAQLKKQIGEAERAYDILKADNEKLSKRMEEKNQENLGLQENLSTAHRDLTSLNLENQKSIEMLYASKNESLHLRDQLQSIRNSSSWRVGCVISLALKKSMEFFQLPCKIYKIKQKRCQENRI